MVKGNSVDVAVVEVGVVQCSVELARHASPASACHVDDPQKNNKTMYKKGSLPILQTVRR
jgi:hypothetical protein